MKIYSLNEVLRQPDPQTVKIAGTIDRAILGTGMLEMEITFENHLYVSMALHEAALCAFIEDLNVTCESILKGKRVQGYLVDGFLYGISVQG